MIILLQLIRDLRSRDSVACSRELHVQKRFDTGTYPCRTRWEKLCSEISAMSGSKKFSICQHTPQTGF